MPLQEVSLSLPSEFILTEPTPDWLKWTRIALAATAVAGAVLLITSVLTLAPGSTALFATASAGGILISASIAVLLLLDRPRKSLETIKEEEFIQWAHNEALELALSKCTTQAPKPIARPNCESLYQPINPEIAQLVSQLDSLRTELQSALTRETDPWTDPEFILAAHEFFQISYAISHLTLQDLPAFHEKHQLNRPNHQALSASDSYQFITALALPYAYHLLRAMPTRDLTQSSTTPSSYAESFYREGTCQYDWRILYNHYCDHLKELTGDKNPFAARTIKDESLETFEPYR